MDTLVLIPAYKPDMRLVTLAQTLRFHSFDVMIVDDGSGADFAPVFEAARAFATVLGYEVNRGKGGAMKYGFSQVTALFPDAKFVVTADADGQHTPEDIRKVSEALAEKGGLVIGSRAFTGKVPFRSRFGNAITRLVFRLASGVYIRDTQSGLRGFSVDLMDDLASLKGDRYEYEMEVLLHAAESGIPMTEIDIETIYEEGNPTSHFNPLRDSFRIYKCIYMNSTGLKFITSSLIAFVIDYVISLILYNGFGVNLELAALIAWVCSSLCNFALNYFFAFRSKVSLPRALGEYYALAVVVFLIKKYGFQELFVRLLHIPLAIASPMAEIVMYPINYLIQKKLIFKRKK